MPPSRYSHRLAPGNVQTQTSSQRLTGRRSCVPTPRVSRFSSALKCATLLPLPTPSRCPCPPVPAGMCHSLSRSLIGPPNYPPTPKGCRRALAPRSALPLPPPGQRSSPAPGPVPLCPRPAAAPARPGTGRRGRSAGYAPRSNALAPGRGAVGRAGNGEPGKRRKNRVSWRSKVRSVARIGLFAHPRPGPDRWSRSPNIAPPATVGSGWGRVRG